MTFHEDCTLAEIAATSLAATTLLEKHGLDYCCGGKQSLSAACQDKGLSAATVLAELEQAATPTGSEGTGWNTAALAELIRHILSTHHDYLKRELPALETRLRKVVSVHGERDPQSLPRLLEIYTALRGELELHMHKEEAILFPSIERYEAAISARAGVPFLPFGSFANPIGMMHHEHDSAGEALRAMRQVTGDYTLPAHACSTYRALFEGLEALEADLHVHIHLENNILFPRALKLESSRN